LDIRELEAGASAIFAAAASELIFAWKSPRSTLPQAVYLPTREARELRKLANRYEQGRDLGLVD